MNVQVCPKCHRVFDEQVQRTRHHILPHRFYHSSDIIYLCRDCHDQIEKRIPLKQKLSESVYYLIVNNFLGYNAVERS